jgi:tetratricopeptide (TPR) repeat protein
MIARGAARAWLLLGLLACAQESTPKQEADPPALQERLAPLRAASNAAPKDARARAEVALAFEANGYWSEAAAHYRAARELDREEPLWALHAAICSAEMGDLDLARREFEAGAARFEEYAPLQQRLGLTLLDDGDFARAREIFERLAQSQPELAEAWCGAAEAALGARDTTAALMFCERALALDPEYALAHHLRGECLERTGRSAEAAAERRLAPRAQRRLLADEWSSRAVEFMVGFEARFAHSLRLSAQRRDQAAKSLLEDLVRERPDDVRAWGNLAMAQAQCGELAAALASCDTGLGLAPHSVELHAARARVLLGSNRGQEACVAARRTVELKPQDAEMWSLLASVVGACGRKSEAREALKEALQLEPGNAGYRERLKQLEQR